MFSLEELEQVWLELELTLQVLNGLLQLLNALGCETALGVVTGGHVLGRQVLEANVVQSRVDLESICAFGRPCA